MKLDKRGRKVVVLEHAESIGKKIAISGGGRCNFTNLNTSADNFISANPHFCKSALARYTPADFISLVEKHGIAYHEKKLGQLFCDGSSRQIIEMLLTEARDAGVEIRCGSMVRQALAGRRRQQMQLSRKFDNRNQVSRYASAASRSWLPPAACRSRHLARPTSVTVWLVSLISQFVSRGRRSFPFTLSREVLRELAPLSGISHRRHQSVVRAHSFAKIF